MRKILYAVIFISSFLCVDAQDKIAFEAKSQTQYINKFGSVDKDKNIISVEGKNPRWNEVAAIMLGKFKPNTKYEISLSYKMTKGEDSPANYLYLYLREQTQKNPSRDYATKELTYSKEFRKEKIVFKTDDLAKDYAIGFSTFNPLACEIKDILAKEIEPDQFIPIVNSETEVEVNTSELPKGAQEFEVDLPRNEKEIVVDATEFGLSEDAENCASILNLALQHCKKIGATKLILPKGKYKIFEENPIRLKDFTDFTLDGQGSTLIYRKRFSGNMVIENCLRTKICNLNMDWDWKTDPLASLVKVVGLEAGNYADFEFYEYKKFPNKNVRVSNLSAFDKKAGSVGLENGATLSFEMKRGLHKPPKTAWTNENTLRVYGIPKQTPLQVGQYYRMQHSYYEMGGIAMNSNKHLTLQDINIWSCSGQATRVGGDQQYWQFRNVNIVPPKGKKRRPISATADHCMIETSAGFFKMINCDMGFGADDCINMHDNALFTTKASPKSVRTKSNRNAYLYKIGETLEFRHGDYSPANLKASVTDVKTISKADGVYEIFFDKDIPEPIFDGFVLFNWRYNTHNVIVRNCYFHENRARGILVIARDVTIENCKFYRNEMGAIKIETGYTFNSWSEGLGVNNVVVRNCSFDTSNPLGIRNDTFERDIFMGVYMQKDPSTMRTLYPIIKNILFENNKFKDTFGLTAFISSSANVWFLNNTFKNQTTRKNPLSYRGCFYLTHSENIAIINNTFEESKITPKLGVYIDRATVKNTTVKGNKVILKKEENLTK